MNKFEEELRNGKFVCSECIKCNKLVWPPSDFCNICFNKVRWRQISKRGKIVESSKKDNIVFCIAEFENAIRIMGELEAGSKIPLPGHDLELIRCSYDNKEQFFFKLII